MKKKGVVKKSFFAVIAAFSIIVSFVVVNAYLPSVSDDPLVRMPGTQPDQGVNLEAPGRCLNCHAGYNQSVEPGHNWMGSMMAQAARDPIFWACMTVAGQDSVWAIGTPNAIDICERCHFPEGWLGGRSDPPNASAMTGSDYDGLHCDFCHRMYDPFFEDTYNGTREGNDWTGYWDEEGPLSQSEADTTYGEDSVLAQVIKLFNGQDFFINNRPQSPNYTENGSGQYFVSTKSAKRASFADAAARHKMLYSRYHKSKYFCATCHDVSNPALANLGADPTQPLPTETDSASSYFHVERTFSEFMLSAYGQQGGAATNADFQQQGAPNITWAAKCQDCHMRDITGKACNKQGVPSRPGESTEHPDSGQPLHDLTGGNTWITHILASLDPNGPVYDPVNLALLDQGPSVLTLDLSQGMSPKQNGAALKAGSDRARQQLQLAATIKDLTYNSGNGDISFKVQNNTGHKLISGFPEGRRMFVNIKAYDGSDNLIYEVNPYDYSVGTLKGLSNSSSSPPLGAGEVYVDELVYEVHPSSDLTGEEQTFHFVLATGRSKDIRIPPKGFDIANAVERLCEPWYHNQQRLDYFTAAEYAGGYDDVSLSIASGADLVEVTVYYQGTSREYIEFLRDEINGDGARTLPDTAYIVQTDPFFAQLAAWGDVIWQLWWHNHRLDGSGDPEVDGVDGIIPFAMTQASTQVAGCAAPPQTLISATAADKEVALVWSDESADPDVAGYSVYYDQAGKAQWITDIASPGTTGYTDTGLTNGQEYCYKVTSQYVDCESAYSNIFCATPEPPGQMVTVGVNAMETGRYVTTGKGKNRTTTFELTVTFTAGDGVVVHAYVVGEQGNPVANATVGIQITGSETANITSDLSDASGLAVATWQTESPNKRGQGGTVPGSYSANVSNVTAGNYVWDGVSTSTSFTIQ